MEAYLEIFPKAQSDQDSALSLTWWALAFTFILSSIIPSSFPKTTVVLKHTNNNNNTLLFSIILYSLSLSLRFKMLKQISQKQRRSYYKEDCGIRKGINGIGNFILYMYGGWVSERDREGGPRGGVWEIPLDEYCCRVDTSL